MKKSIIFTGTILLLASAVLMNLAPDSLSMLILGIMILVITLGFSLGLYQSMICSNGFRTARKNMEKSLDVQSTESWIAVFNTNSLFREKRLDQIFSEYKEKVAKDKEDGVLISDIADYINEDYLTLRTWQGFVLQVPGILTGLGILGTFIGLLNGIHFINFRSVDGAIESIAELLSGINTAFYTSIAGVILSIIFNILYRIIWNSVLREHAMFLDAFHRTAIPGTEEQLKKKQNDDVERVIERLDRIPKDFDLFTKTGSDASWNEQALMPQIMKGLKNGEFTFYLQPIMDLKNKNIVSAEALVRWNHKDLGILNPASFIPVLEGNGYVTKLDSYIWDLVCRMIREQLDKGIRISPVSINISQTDIMAMDLTEYIGGLLKKYKIPPRLLDIEIPMAAYQKNPEITNETAGALRQMGIRVVMDEFDGDFVFMNQIEADALKLDLRKISDKHTIDAVFKKAKDINIDITADGIENAEQISLLKQAGCKVGQGYFLSKPIDAEVYRKLS